VAEKESNFSDIRHIENDGEQIGGAQITRVHIARVFSEEAQLQ
jgi:hypothetical protein